MDNSSPPLKDTKSRKDFLVQVAAGTVVALVTIALGFIPNVRNEILQKISVSIAFLLLLALLSTATGAILTYLWQQRRVKEWRSAALTDPLTRIPNYAGIDAELDRQITSHTASHQKFACIVFDINGFGDFNDRFGDAIGDSVIKQTVGFLKENTWPAKGDILIRYKLGDEFLLILPDTDIEGAIACANRLLESFRKFGVQVGSRYEKEHPTLSAGIVEFSPDGDSRNQLRVRLDEALRQAKAGDNKVAYIRQVTTQTRSNL